MGSHMIKVMFKSVSTKNEWLEALVALGERLTEGRVTVTRDPGDTPTAPRVDLSFTTELSAIVAAIADPYAIETWSGYSRRHNVTARALHRLAAATINCVALLGENGDEILGAAGARETIIAALLRAAITRQEELANWLHAMSKDCDARLRYFTTRLDGSTESQIECDINAGGA